MDIFLRPLLAAGLALTLLPGCSGGTTRSSLLHTPLGPDLQALWKAHGGLEKWGRFAGVSLDYQGTGVGALASAGKVSCKVIIDLEPPPSVTWNPEATEVAGEPQKELAASFLADLFHLPFALNQPGWKFRRAMVLPNTNTSSVEFEASRPTGANQTGPFFFRFSQIQDGLPSVHYFCRNALLGEGVYRVDFHDYKLIQGVLVATTRKHYSISGSGNSPAAIKGEPFRPLHKPGNSLLWIEKFSNLRFLKPEDLQKPPPEKNTKPGNG